MPGHWVAKQSTLKICQIPEKNTVVQVILGKADACEPGLSGAVMLNLAANLQISP